MSTQPDTLRVVAWNLNHRKHPTAAAARQKWLQQAAADLLILPEPPKPAQGEEEANLREELTALGLTHGSWHYGAGRTNGLALVTRLPLQAVQASLPDAAGGDVSLHKFIHAQVDWHGPLHVLAVSVPTSARGDGHDKIAFVTALLRYIEAQGLHRRRTLLAGDFNLIFDKRFDMEPGARWPFDPWEFAAMQQLLDWGFVDSWRALHGAAPLYTWRMKYGYRLDHVLPSAALAPGLRSITADLSVVGTIAAGKPSDHAALLVELSAGRAGAQ